MDDQRETMEGKSKKDWYTVDFLMAMRENMMFRLL